MAKREKILLIGAALALIVGALYLLTSGPSTKRAQEESPSSAGGSKDFLERLNQEMGKETLSAAEGYILKRAALEWQSDPTLGKVLSPEQKAGKLGANVSEVFQYTGYVSVGKERIAVINGLEYETGDQLASGDAVVRAIEPERVILELRGNAVKIVVPFQGD